MRRSFPIFACILALLCWASAAPVYAGAGGGGAGGGGGTQGKVDCAISCNKDCGTHKASGLKGKDLGVCCKSWGCCPTKEVSAFATACKSLINNKDFDSDALYIPAGNGKVPFRCGREGSGKQYVMPNVAYNPGAGSEQNYSCQVRIVGNDDSNCDEGEGGGVTNVSTAGAKRKYCIKKHQEKKTACQWRMELMLGADQQAVASSANPSTPGFEKMPFGTAEWLCEKTPNSVPHSNDSYKNKENPKRHKQGQTAGGVQGEAAGNAFFQNVPFFSNRPDGGTSGGGGMSVSSGMIGVAASGAGGGGGGCTPEQGNCIHNNYGEDTNMCATDGKGGCLPFNGKQGGYSTADAETVSKNHPYNRDASTGWMTAEDAVFLNTPAYATYDPADYPPGKELALAKQLKGKTREEVLAAKQFDHLIVNESLAGLPGIGGGGIGGVKGLIEKLQPNSFKNTTNSQVMKFMSSLSMAKGDYGLKLMNMFGPGANGLMALLNGGGFSSILQQMLSGGGGGGGGDGGGGGTGLPATCTIDKFGDPDKCIASLAKAPANVNLKQYSFDGCPRSVLDCMESNTASEYSRCNIEEADKHCTPADTGTGGAETLGTSFVGGMGGMQSLGNIKSLFGNMGGGGSMQNLLKNMAPKQLTDFKKTNFLQIFHPETFAPMANFMKFPERDHYSNCATLGKCSLTEKMAKYDKYVPYHFNAKDASRCSGTLNNLIRVNVLEPRYDEFNSHQAQRIHYNRWCKADELDKNRCEPGHVCCPKPCHPKTPCFTKLCYGNAPPGKAPRCKKQTLVNAENPPAAQRHDHAFDSGGYEHMMDCCPPGTTEVCTKAYNSRGMFTGFTWGYHPDVKQEMFDWAKQAGGDLILTPKEKLFNNICHDLAKPLPVINKFAAVDGRKLAGGGGGMQVMGPLGASNAMAQGGGGAYAVGETLLYTSLFGNSRPFVALDTTGKELGQTGPRPDLFKDDGGYLVANYSPSSTPAQAATQTAAVNMPWPTFDMGFNDGALGLVKDTLANAGGGGGGGGNSFTGCYGGTGGKTGEGCGSNGADPAASPAEQKIQQMYNARDFGLSCMMNGDKALQVGMPISHIANHTGAQHQRLIKEQLPNNSGQKGGGQTATLSSFNWANACRGAPDQVQAAEAFPFGGGVKAPKVETSLSKLADMRRNAGGAVLFSKTGFAEKQPGGFPSAAVVLYAFDPSAGAGGAGMLSAANAGGGGGGGDYCFVVRQTNAGNWPDNFGRNSGWGQSQTRYMCNKIPKLAEDAIKKMKPKREDCITPSDGPEYCKLPEQGTQWVHYGLDENKSKQAKTDSKGKTVAGVEE